MMLPVIDALTTADVVRAERAMAMISSAAFPNVAFRKPPSWAGALRQLIGRRTDQARCRNEVRAPPRTNSHLGLTWLHASHQLTGAAMSRTFSQLEVNVWRI